MRIRIVKTSSGKHAMQVVSKKHGELTLHKHIGSYKTENEKSLLLFKAKAFIDSHDNIQQDLFEKQLPFLQPSDIKITQSQPLFLYRLLCKAYDTLGLNSFSDEVIKDLVIARVYSPVSKRETAEVLEDSFGKNYSVKTLYRHLKTAVDNGVKDQFQIALISFVQKGLNDSLRLVFYDVTTLAFDSQVKKGLKDFGFSKDHRFHDVQVVVGLVVNQDGFPLYFDVFNGKTFEGKTFITVVEKVKTLLHNPELVVIADAAMVSRINVEELDKRGIGFIVGARLANLPVSLQKQISQNVLSQDLKTTTVSYLSHRLICQYSASRAAKDRSDRKKQIEKAKIVVSFPSQISRRFRFVQTVNGKYEINNTLIEKAKRLEGIKGYLTNTKFDEDIVIERYHDLWKIEKDFRVTKTDLEARPIFLQLDKTIICHLVIVFAALAICRYLEINTNMSVQKILKIAQKVLTHKVTVIKTGETGFIETTIEDIELCGQLKQLRVLGH